MAKLQRNCGFYPDGDEPTNVWGLCPAGTATVAPMRIPPGALVTTPVNGNIENDGAHFYVTLNNTRYIISVAKLVAAKGDLLVASASGTLARLAVGSDKQLLMADSAQATGIKWAKPSADSIAFSATDRLLGRASAEAGAGEEIVCTAAGRALLDDTSAAEQRTTLGLIDDVAILAPGTAVAWTDQPADLTELFGLTIHRTKFDLTTASQARLLVNVAAAGAMGAKLIAQYSTDQSTWYYLDGSSGPAAGIDSVGLVVSSWVNLAAGAKADVFLRVIGLDGDGVADPAFGRVSVQFR